MPPVSVLMHHHSDIPTALSSRGAAVVNKDFGSFFFAASRLDSALDASDRTRGRLAAG